MQVPNSTDNSSAVLSKRQQRAEKRGNSNGRPVTPPQPEVTAQRVPQPPVPTVVLVNNKEMGRLRELEARVVDLENENSELKKTHETAMAVMESKLADMSLENHRMAELLAVKNQQVVAPDYTCDVVVEERVQPLVSDPNPNTKGVPTPTVLDLRQILKDLSPSFNEFRALGESINTLRDKVQTLMYNGNLSIEDLEKEVKPFLDKYSDLNKKAAMTRKTVEDNIAKLKKMYVDGSFKAVPEEHQRSMSSMNMLPMGVIVDNIAGYTAAHKDCKREIDKMVMDYEKVKTRFANARDHINTIINRIEPRAWFFTSQSPMKYEYVSSAMENN